MNRDDRIDIVKYLVEHGANVNIENNLDKSPYYIAKHNKNEKIAEYLYDKMTIKPITEELKHLPPPSNEEYNDALNNMSAEEIYKNCVKYNLGEEAFQKAVDKGLFNEHTSPNTMLIIAGQCGSLNYIKKALNNGADINCFSRDFGSVLINSCIKGRMNIVKYLVEKCNADVNINNNGFTPLMSACNGEEEYLNIVKYLIKRGANINQQSNNFKTALLYSISNEYCDTAEFLIKNGANLELRDDYNYTPLMRACDHEIFKMIKLLIDNGANVNPKIKGMWSGQIINPLYIAILKNNLEIVKYLVENGANINFEYGRENLIQIANRKNFIEIEQYLIKKKAEKKKQRFIN